MDKELRNDKEMLLKFVNQKMYIQYNNTKQVRLHLNVKFFNGIRMTGFVVGLFCIILFVK